MILDGQGGEGVPGFDLVILLGGLFGGLPFRLLAFLFFGKKDFLLLVLGLGNIFAGCAQIPLLEHKYTASEGAGLKVAEPLRVKGVALVSGLEVEMWASGVPGGAAESDDIPGADPVIDLDIPSGEVSVCGLQAVVMPDDDDIAIAAGIF